MIDTKHCYVCRGDLVESAKPTTISKPIIAAHIVWACVSCGRNFTIGELDASASQQKQGDSNE